MTNTGIIHTYDTKLLTPGVTGSHARPVLRNPHGAAPQSTVHLFYSGGLDPYSSNYSPTASEFDFVWKSRMSREPYRYSLSGASVNYGTNRGPLGAGIELYNTGSWMFAAVDNYYSSSHGFTGGI